MNLKGILADLREQSDLRDGLEGYALSAIFHVLLLMVLASITLSASGDGFGLGRRPKGANVHLVVSEDAVDDTQLEELLDDVEVKPLEVQPTQNRPVTLPELASFSAPRPSAQRLSSVRTRFTPTSGGVGGLSGQFGNFIVGLRKSGLDIVIMIDATASMQHVIDEIKARAGRLVGRIQALVPIARVGVVAFRDRGDEFVVRWTDLSFHGSKIQSFLDNLTAAGGGDYEEAVREGLEAAMDDLSWRKRAKRVIIVVGSSPPHKEDVPAIHALAKEFQEQGGVISTIDLTRRMHEEYQMRMHEWLYGNAPDTISEMPAFYDEVRTSYRMIADTGGGELAALGADDQLAEQILTFAFGSRWQNEVARYTSE